MHIRVPQEDLARRSTPLRDACERCEGMVQDMGWVAKLGNYHCLSSDIWLLR